MIFGRCSDCCKICCCEFDENIGQYRLFRGKSKRQCEASGGSVVLCLPAGFCQCECTTTLTVNGVQIPIDQLGSGRPWSTATEVDRRQSAVPVCGNGDQTEWQFLASAEYGCRDFYGVEQYLFRVYLWIQLWWVFANGQKVLVNPGGLDFIGYMLFDYIFETAGEYEVGYPCPKPGPPLVYSDGGAVDISLFGCATPPGWDDELAGFLAPLSAHQITIECDTLVQVCEGS